MKRHLCLCIVLMLLASGTTLLAQQRSPVPPPATTTTPTPAPGPQLILPLDPARAAELLQVQQLLQRAQQPNVDPQDRLNMLREAERALARAQQANAGRFARGLGLQGGNPDLVGEIKLILSPVDTLAAGRILTAVPVTAANGAWWTDAALVTRLGLSEDQKARIERAFENYRQNLTTSKDTLEKEETQLSKLLGAEPVDRTLTVAQIQKVVQARSEVERISSLMTLEMREVLTRAQWTQLEAQQGTNRLLVFRTGQNSGATPNLQPGAPRGGGRGARQ